MDQTSLQTGASSFSLAEWTRFSVPTKEEFLSSGFPLDQRLQELGVTDELWHLFTSDVIKAARITMGDDFLAWVAGISTGTLLLPFLLPFGPWVGWRTGKKVHRNKLTAIVKERLLEGGSMISILREWNQGEWKQRSFNVWLEFPGDPGVDVDKKRFRLAIIPNNRTQTRYQQSIASPVQQTVSTSSPTQSHNPPPYDKRPEVSYSPRPSEKVVETLPVDRPSNVNVPQHSHRTIMEMPSQQLETYEMDGGNVPVR